MECGEVDGLRYYHWTNCTLLLTKEMVQYNRYATLPINSRKYIINNSIY